jgi:NTP pyrophosphatase (non-canonical NTP hydrolase)
MIERIKQINQGLNKVFPHGNNPFQMITRLVEECGELAEQVNHFEGAGVKQKKHGAPDKQKLAKEIQDVLRCVLQLATYYDIEAELEASIEKAYRKMQAEGLIET